MKNILATVTLLALMFKCITSSAQCTLNRQALGDPIFHDDFNYSSLSDMISSGGWYFEYPWGAANPGSGLYPVNSNVHTPGMLLFPNDGTVVLRTEQVSPF